MVTYPSSGAKAGSQAQEALKERQTVNRAEPAPAPAPQDPPMDGRGVDEGGELIEVFCKPSISASIPNRIK
ncbi:hypothetical protein PIB30_081668 [Stylosanthes scabra]|uniref:Uncharacterized protein n=1 Tax=Stylosanthes scabra TaxID=79078 RepID=A0ABU6VTU2_9FABA|nr:hypothetical protein [Stylosanthes scabra]